MPTSLSSAIAEFVAAKKAARLSPHTLADYQNTYRQFLAWLGADPPVAEITAQQLTAFLASRQDVSHKTTANYHCGLSSLWRWLTENQLATANLLGSIQRPNTTPPEIIPFSRAEFEALLTAAHAGQNPLRDRAILLLLLDTGLRATELCQLTIGELRLDSRHCTIRNGKGHKDRDLRFSTPVQQALTDYLQTRTGWPRLRQAAGIFTTDADQPFRRDTLRQIMDRLAIRANLYHVHPHRFRHTFALEFLRNGGNIYALQKMLGHTSLDMVQRYLQIVQADLDKFFDHASPVVNWNIPPPHSSGP